VRILLPLPLIVALAAPLAAQSTLLNQPPIIPGPNYTFSGSGSFAQVLAEDFVVGAGGGELTTVRVWGVYWQSNTPATDSFTVNVYNESGGLPFGAPVASWTNPPSTRTAAGFTAGGFNPYDVYEYAIDLGAGVSLAAGSYLIEVYNQPANGDIWAIANGTLDPVAGIPSFAFSGSLPASTWNRSTSSYDLAFALEGPGFSISLVSACGGPNTLLISGATPGGLVAVGYSATLGPWSVPGGAAACSGALLDIVSPTRVANLIADGAGAASFAGNVPAGACGVLHLQAFDVATCSGSNVLSL
jgi:hypothetical protein